MTRNLLENDIRNDIEHKSDDWQRASYNCDETHSQTVMSISIDVEHGTECRKMGTSALNFFIINSHSVAICIIPIPYTGVGAGESCQMESKEKC